MVSASATVQLSSSPTNSGNSPGRTSLEGQSESSVQLMSDLVSQEPEESSVFSILENGEEVLALESFEGRHRVRDGTSEMLLQYMLGEERYRDSTSFFSLFLIWKGCQPRFVIFLQRSD